MVKKDSASQYWLQTKRMELCRMEAQPVLLSQDKNVDIKRQFIINQYIKLFELRKTYWLHATMTINAVVSPI